MSMTIVDVSRLMKKEDYRPLKKEKQENIDFIADLKQMNSHNKIVDFLNTGVRGDGKTTWAMGLCCKLDRNFSVRNIVFDKHEFIYLAATLDPGSAILFDEGGTTESGMSSRKSMSNENQEVNDVWRKVRTKGIYLIVISPDKGDIDKRVRDSFRFICTPIAMLSDTETDGWGMAVKAMVVENYKEYDDEELFRLKKRFYKNIKYITIPAPPADLIYQYEKKRDRSLNYSIQRAMK